MSFEIKLTLKYLRSKRKGLARFTSFAAVTGIAVGVASLIIAQSLARGFQDEMRDKILGNTAHVTVFFSDLTEMNNWREIKSEVEKIANVSTVTPTTYENSVLIGKDASSYSIIKVQDSSGNLPNSTESHDFQSHIKNDSIEISIGAELAKKSNLQSGDEAEIITFANENAPKSTRVSIKNTFETGLFEYDSTWIYVSPQNYAALTNQANFAPTILAVSVKDIYNADETARRIKDKLGNGFRVIAWQQANQSLFAALSLERKVSFAIISLIIFIAVLNVTTTLALLVNERKFDMAILRTCGAKTKSLVSIFLFEGLSLGFSGVFAGVALGLIGCFLGNRFKLINISAEVYSLSYIPFHPNFSNVLLIIFTTLFLCLSATVYPAYKASKIKPLDNFRKA